MTEHQHSSQRVRYWLLGAAAGDVAARAAGPERLGAELALKLHETPDLCAIRPDVGLDLGGGLADGGQVGAEQLRAPLERGRDRPAVPSADGCLAERNTGA